MISKEKEYDQFQLVIQSNDEIRAIRDSHDKLREFASARLSEDERLLEDIRKGILKLKDDKDDLEDIERLGRDLFEAIFQGDVGKLFEESINILLKDRRTNRNRCLRLIIDVNTKSEVFGWPLEFLRYKDLFWLAKEKPALTLSRRISFKGKSGIIDLNPQTPPLRLLVIVSKPTDDELGGVITTKVLERIGHLAVSDPNIEGWGTEKRMEVHVLGQIAKYEKGIPGINYLDQPATYENIINLISELYEQGEEPHVIHFIGHGKFDQEGFLGLVDREGKVDWVRAKDISDLFNNWKPRLILLQACEGSKKDPGPGFISLADYLIQRSIPAVVAMQFSITNNYATLFAEGFYEALRDRYNIDEAVQIGRWKMYNKERGHNHHFGNPVLIAYDPEVFILFSKSSRYERRGQSLYEPSPSPNITQPLHKDQQARKMIGSALDLLREGGEETQQPINIFMNRAQKILGEINKREELRLVEGAIGMYEIGDLEGTISMLELAHLKLKRTEKIKPPPPKIVKSLGSDQDKSPSTSRKGLAINN
jgi:hypothetical protein